MFSVGKQVVITTDDRQQSREEGNSNNRKLLTLKRSFMKSLESLNILVIIILSRFC